jgi:predicted helicase
MKYEKSIRRYLNKRLEHEKHGDNKESTIRGAFHELIREAAKASGAKNPYICAEKTEKTAVGRNIYYDMVLFREPASLVPWGMVEDKDINDDLAKAADEKRRAGYSFENIIFENGSEAWLYQDKKPEPVMRACFRPPYAKDRLINKEPELEAFDALLERFVSYTSEEERQYEQKLAAFKEGVPKLSGKIRESIDEAYAGNTTFRSLFTEYEAALRLAIGEALTADDVKDMLVQHILTADLFEEILGRGDYRKFNSIAQMLDRLLEALGQEFTFEVSEQIRPFYAALAWQIKRRNSARYSIEVLQTFYETFYKAYDVKRADTFGIVYTPAEAVDFMVNMADSLLKKHFDKHIYSKDVHVLDPCTGTGGFMVSILDYIAAYAKGDLEYKFKNELHANELSILAYYIGNIHIELKYRELMGRFESFDAMCYMDTLDNDFASRKQHGKKQSSFDFGLTEENAKRVRRQNETEIRLIIGNPPYNANQANENQNNKNKRYEIIDKQIKETYKQESRAQKLKLEDMYVRFIRWASDRILMGEGKGIVAFITNRSFLDAFGFDGFRKSVAAEFSHIYTIDLGGDVRKGGMGGNIFDIMTGVAITFFVRSGQRHGGIFYLNPFKAIDSKENKLDWLRHNSQCDHTALAWRRIEPDAKGNWLNQSSSNFDKLLPLGSKEHKGKADAEAIFLLYSNGVKTNRDSWVYDKDAVNLSKKMCYFIDCYEAEMRRWHSLPEEEKGDSEQTNEKLLNNFLTRNIKWNYDLNIHLLKERSKSFNKKNIVKSLYRPFSLKFLYMNSHYIQRLYQMPKIFPTGKQEENLAIGVSGIASLKPFSAYVLPLISDLGFLNGTQCFPLYRYDADGRRHSNINPDYRAKFGPNVTDEELFYYIYAVLHHPLYRQTYKTDLQQNLPAVPVSPAFAQLAALGKELGLLHTAFEDAEPYNVTRSDKDVAFPQLKLKSSPEKGEIQIDEATRLSNIPSEAWSYKLGNRSAIDWVLEGYKVKKISPDDGDIADSSSPLYTQYGYQAYQFAPYKEECIMLVRRIITLSLKTQHITAAIEKLPLDNAGA